MCDDDNCDELIVSNSEDKNSLILDFMSKDYENEMDRKNILDNKSSTLIAFTGVILTFQGGLTSLMFNNILNESIEFKIIFLLIFMSSLFCYVVALYFFIKAYSITLWEFIPVNDRIYYDFKDRKTQKKDIMVQTICFYNKAISKNKNTLIKKVEKIKRAMNFLQAGIILTVVYIAVYCIKLI